MIKYLAVFHEFEPFHGKNKEKKRFWIPEYDLNNDLRSFNHQRTGRTEIKELTKEVYNKLTNKQKDQVIVRKENE